MIDELNWGVIRNGATFEALMQALVFSEDADAKLMDRPGKDKAVDALSGDGRTVFQAKFGTGLKMDDVIALSQGEMAKIRGLRAEQDVTWTPVKRWVLYANVTENTWDVEKWQTFETEVVRPLGLEIECRSVAYMNQQLLDHPQIRHVFFGRLNRCLLYASEAYQTLSEQSFLGCFHRTPFIGRDAEMVELLHAFDHPGCRLAVVKGAPGVGRTRFLYEAMAAMGCAGVRAYWGLKTSLLASDSWYEDVSLGQRVVVFVDDCDTPDLLNLILDQMSGFGHEQVQFIIGISSEQSRSLDPILRKVAIKAEILLQPLSSETMMRMLEKYDGQKVSPETAGGICRLAKGFPGWASFILAAKVDPDQSSVMKLAGDVLSRLFQNIPDSTRYQALTLVRWLALWGKVDFDGKDASAVLQFLQSQGFDTRNIDEVVRQLGQNAIINRSTAHGNVCRITNRILQHELLLEWLIDLEAYEGGHFRINGVGRRLIELLMLGAVPLMPAALDTLARMSLSHLPNPDAETFVGPILKDVGAKLREATSVTARDEAYAFEVVSRLGTCSPMSALDILRQIFMSHAASVEISDARMPIWTLTHEQVSARLPWLAGAISEVLDEHEAAKSYFDFLLELWDAQISGALEPETSEAPGAIIQRLVTSSRPANPFHRIAFDYVKEGLAAAAISDRTCEIAGWLFTLQLSRSYSPVNFQVVLENARVVPGTELWAYREELREGIWNAAAEESHPERRTTYWKLLASEHTALSIGCFEEKRERGDSVGLDQMLTIIRDDLAAMRRFLEGHDALLAFDERVEMRKMWERHLDSRYSVMPQDVRELAQGCEEFYRGRSVYNVQALYQPDDEMIDVQPEMVKTVERFVRATGVSSIKDYLVEAENYLKIVRGDAESDFGRTEELAYGCLAHEDVKYQIGDGSVLDQYVLDVVGRFAKSGVEERKFVVAIIRESFKKIKQIDPDLDLFKGGFKKVVDCAKQHSAENVGAVMAAVFDRANEHSTGKFSEWEFEQLEGGEVGLSAFSCACVLPVYYGVAGDRVLDKLKDALDSTQGGPDEQSRLLSRMVFGWYVATFQEAVKPDSNLLEWILDRILAGEPDMGVFYSHHLEYLLTSCSHKYSLGRLKQFFARGVDFEYGFAITKYFQVGEDWETFDELCHWVVEDGGPEFLRRYKLPHYLIALAGNHDKIFEFVKEQTGASQVSERTLSRCARFAGFYNNTSDEWQKLAKKICDAAIHLPEEDRTNVYAYLNPQLQMWHGTVGKVSPDIIRRCEVANERLSQIDATDPLRGYWTYELACATAHYHQAQAEAEDESDE